MKTARTRAPAWLCLSMLLAVGCFPMKTYEIPESARDGRFVKLTHRASVMKYVDMSDRRLRQRISVHVVAPDGDECPEPDRYAARDIAPLELDRHGLRYGRNRTRLDIDVPVDLLVFVDTLFVKREYGRTEHCRTGIGFVPRAGHEYEYRFRLGSDSCTAEIFDEEEREVPVTDLSKCREFRDWSEEQAILEAESSI